MASTKTSGRSKLVSDLVRILVRTKAIRTGPFQLPDGTLTPYYIDLRVVPNYPDLFRRIIDAYLNLIRSRPGIAKLDGLVGSGVTGPVYAAVLSYLLGKTLLYVQETGGESRLIGRIKPGTSLLVVDDLVATGGSIISTAQTVRRNGGRVDSALVLIDRVTDPKSLRKAGIRLHSLTTIGEVGRILKESGLVEEDELSAIG